MIKQITHQLEHAAELKSRPQTSQDFDAFDVDHGDNAKTLLSLNASYTLFATESILVRLVAHTDGSNHTLASLARGAPRPSIVPRELLPRRDRAVLSNSNECLQTKRRYLLRQSSITVSALRRESVKNNAVKRRRMPPVDASGGYAAFLPPVLCIYEI
jgi:hypothetical protein